MGLVSGIDNGIGCSWFRIRVGNMGLILGSGGSLDYRLGDGGDKSQGERA